MLHDHEDGGKISRKRGQYLAQRPQTACGCGKRDDVKGAAELSWLLRIILYRNTFFLFANKAYKTPFLASDWRITQPTVIGRRR
jgi:hypothetical protein